jgi:DNA-binding transcriptional LysR family regulator
MKLHFLKYFSVLAEELHFHRAAERLAISQPPLSAAIKSLEEELGAQLFRRNSKKVELTTAGEAFLIEAREIQERVARAGSLIRAIDQGISGRLHIGISASLLYREVPRVVARFQASAPAVEIVLHELASAEQIEKISRGQLDAGFAHGAKVPAPLKYMAFKDDDYVICLSEKHPSAGRASIELRELADDTFVMFSREAAPANHDNVIAIFSTAGIHPRTVHSARTWLTIIAMVAQVSGVAIVPKSLSKAKIDGVRFLPLRGASSTAPAMLVWNPDLMSNPMTQFIESAARVLKVSP